MMIFHEILSSEITMAYKEGNGPVMVVTKYDHQSGCNRQTEFLITEEEWEGIKKYMEKVYP